ncbi:MAG TPA: thioredoxin family protein [Candidatus Hydrogenedentes bacterium]|nr:thioredoxin family protein [Candidatus Hydrogenedentota bacterium]
MKKNVLSLIILLLAGLMTSVGFSAESDASSSIDALYPGLTSGGLCFATTGELPENILLKSGALEITSAALDEEILKSPEAAREKLKKNAFFVLEQMASKQLLLEAAKQKAAEAKKDISSTAENDLLNEYLRGQVSQIQATDDEVTKFYEENKDSCGGATLEQLKDQLKQYVGKEKQQEAVKEHIRTLGKRVPIILAAGWVKTQAGNANDNPVNKARSSGKPSLVDFGSTGCRPCDMMAPILADMKNKYEGKANVLFVHVREEQFLAARYGIQSIPVQVFFDASGKEVSRHTGFFPQAECEKKLAELGAK